MTTTPERPSAVTAISQGMAVDGSDPQAMAAALSLAFDYRGDVTLHLKDGRVIEGYIFDRTRPAQGRSRIRLLPKDSETRVVVHDDEIARLEVTGKDTAAGKSFENWVKRYVEHRLAGRSASIESESLE